MRTAINAALGYADLLATTGGGSLTDAQSGYVERLRASRGHLLELVNEVLDLARLERDHPATR